MAKFWSVWYYPYQASCGAACGASCPSGLLVLSCCNRVRPGPGQSTIGLDCRHSGWIVDNRIGQPEIGLDSRQQSSIVVNSQQQSSIVVSSRQQSTIVVNSRQQSSMFRFLVDCLDFWNVMTLFRNVMIFRMLRLKTDLSDLET